jgi:pimeloyl-ACP methyl ester carboxylesterase
MGHRHRRGVPARVGRVLAHRFDWRAQEAALNAFPQFKVALHGIDLHFLHVEGKGPAPFPLLLSHGWPGSVFEFLDILPRLTDPARFGGDPADAFTVVAPSLPGYGLSFTPGQPRFGIEQIAECFAALMSDVLGYPRFAAQGGDWGAFVASRLGAVHADKLVGIHLNLLAMRRDPKMIADPSPDERTYLRELEAWLKERDRLPVDPGNAAADARLRAHRFAGWPRGVDRREVPRLVGLRRRRRERLHQGPTARRRRALLVHRRDRRVVLALLRADARAVAIPDGGVHVPMAMPRSARDPARAALARRAHVQRHPALDGDGQGRPLRGDGAAEALAREIVEFFRPCAAESCARPAEPTRTVRPIRVVITRAQARVFPKHLRLRGVFICSKM